MIMSSRSAGLVTGALALLLWLGVIASHGTSLQGAGFQPAGATGAGVAPQEDQRVSPDICLTCHDRAQETRLHEYHGDCQSCHSGAAVHIEAPETGNIERPTATQCLTCHGATMESTWSFGQHAAAEVACSGCHTVHESRTATGIEARATRIDEVSTTCVSCHADVMARFRQPSHHPVTEGAMSCTSCHDPHSGNRTSVLSEVEQCGACHQEQRNPKAIVHPPVAEACSTCHNPHGAANRRLLTMAQPALCLQCHSVADNRHAVGATAGATVSGAVLRNCVACHKAIHGSHMDDHLRF